MEYDGSWRDGELWALNRDRDRLNRVQAAGWEVVFVTASLLHDPVRMVRTVRAALDRRSRLPASPSEPKNAVRLLGRPQGC
ncbi:MAG: hypothetical protein M3308_02655 [Actinomycetota bacterium]|nr:hypothetical protein [Actinomycetota bacterium]